MYLVVLLPSVLAIFALLKQKLTNSATVLAWIFAVIITYYGGLNAFFALTSTFLLTIISDKPKKKNVDKKRNIYQIISNVLTPTVAIILFAVTDSYIFLVMYYTTLASSLADTLASGIGSLSKKKPFNILTLRYVEKGESGGITWLGTNASLLAGLFIGGFYYHTISNINHYLLIILMGLSGSFLDSILGLTVQGKYKCSICNNQVEESIHCDKEAQKIYGLKFIDNNTVNLLNNIIIFIISYIFLYF